MNLDKRVSLKTGLLIFLISFIGSGLGSLIVDRTGHGFDWSSISPIPIAADNSPIPSSAFIQQYYTSVQEPAVRALHRANRLGYVIIDNKIVPLTVLSEEDAKKPCEGCHSDI